MLSAQYRIFFDALKSAVSRCSNPDCGQIWGKIRFLTKGGRYLPVPVGERFFVREITRFPAVAGRHPLPPAYPEPGDHHTTFCGTSSRNNASSPWIAVRRRRVPTQGHFSPKLKEDRFLAMDRAHTLLTVVTAVSIHLCSLLDSSGRLQESSRKHALLQAAYLPRRKTAITHHCLLLENKRKFCTLEYRLTGTVLLCYGS